MKKCPFLLLILILTIVCSASLSHAKTGLFQKHDRWYSQAIYHGKTILFRAYSASTTPGWKESVICFDRYPKNPSAQFMSINIPLNQPNSKTLSYENSSDISAAMRIDDYPIHNMLFRPTYTKGSKLLFLYFKNFSNSKSLLDELEAGRNLRIKMSVGSKEYYLKFSLYGYSAATKRSLSLTKGYNIYVEKKRDAEYFNEDNMSGSDAQYFQ